MINLKQGDCLQLLREIPRGSVDMILCDLPYGTTENSWDKRIDIRALWREYRRVIKSGGAVALFAQMPYACDVINANRDWFRYEWIWEKSCAVGFLNANKMPLRAHENILIFYDKLSKFNPQKTAGESYTRSGGSHRTAIYGRFKPDYKTINSDGQRYPRDVINFAREQHTIHTAQKPVKLCEYLILTYTDPGETVLDNCMGSGSTGVACVNTGRNFIGMELDEKIFDMAKKRIDDSVQGNLFYADFSE